MTESISQEMMFKYSLPGLGDWETEKQDVRCKSYHIMIVKRWQMFDWSIPVCCHLVQSRRGKGDPGMTTWWTHPPSSKLRNIPSRCLFDQLSALGACLRQHSTAARTGDSVQKITLRLPIYDAMKSQKFSIKPTTTLNKTLELID